MQTRKVYHLPTDTYNENKILTHRCRRTILGQCYQRRVVHWSRFHPPHYRQSHLQQVCLRQLSPKGLGLVVHAFYADNHIAWPQVSPARRGAWRHVLNRERLHVSHKTPPLARRAPLHKGLKEMNFIGEFSSATTVSPCLRRQSLWLIVQPRRGRHKRAEQQEDAKHSNTGSELKVVEPIQSIIVEVVFCKKLHREARKNTPLHHRVRKPDGTEEETEPEKERHARFWCSLEVAHTANYLIRHE